MGECQQICETFQDNARGSGRVPMCHTVTNSLGGRRGVVVGMMVLLPLPHPLGNNNTIISRAHNINAMFCFLVIPPLLDGEELYPGYTVHQLFMQSGTNL